MTAEKTTLTVDDCLRGAFQALLRGDLNERDRLCKLTETAFNGRSSVPPETPVDLVVIRSMSPHEVLGIRPGATTKEIDAAYRQKAKVAHPDSGGSLEAMQELNEARAKLKGVA